MRGEVQAEEGEQEEINMTIDELRKNYPFIPYGSQYDGWKWYAKWYKWLLDRILNERPSKTTDHDWRKLAIYLQVELKKRNALFRKLPKPTKEQRYGKDWDIDPLAPGKWPEDRMPDIRVFARSEDEVKRIADKVSAILTKNDYCVNVLKEKTYESRKEEEDEKKKKRKSSGG